MNQDFFVSRALSRLRSDCDDAERQLRHAETMAAVLRTAQVQPDAIVACLDEARTELDRVRAAAAARIVQLLDKQLKALAACEDRATLESEHTKLLATHWNQLRGDFAEQYRLAERGYRQLAARFGSAY